MKNYNISIVVPIYNTALYIEQCLRSLFEQNYNSIEYIFVNDCSTDNSIKILEKIINDYPNRKQDIKVFHNEINKGLGYTRKQGVKKSSGNYILQIDSDDWIENQMCLKLYNKAIDENADIVCSDYFENYHNSQKYIIQKYTSDNWDGFESILSGVLHGSVCNKLIKRELYIKNNIYPPENFSLFEDKIVSLKLFSKAKKIAYINEAFLHYRKHPYSITSILVNSKQVQDTIFFIEELNLFLEKENLLKKYKNQFESCILYHKKIFLLDKKYYHYWENFYPNVNTIKNTYNIQSYGVIKKIITLLSVMGFYSILRITTIIFKKIRSKI